MDGNQLWQIISGMMAAQGVEDIPIQLTVTKSAEATDDGPWLIEGEAGGDGLDLIRESLDMGFIAKTLGYLKAHGKLTWDHSNLLHPDPEKRGVDPEDLVGEIRDAGVRKAADGSVVLWVKGELNKAKKKARDLWDYFKGGQKLGMSIEGIRLATKNMVGQDGPFLRLTPLITNVALTYKPMYPGTWAMAFKALHDGNVESVVAGLAPDSETGSDLTQQQEGFQMQRGQAGTAFGLPGAVAPGEAGHVADPSFREPMTLLEALTSVLQQGLPALKTVSGVLDANRDREIMGDAVAGLDGMIFQVMEELAVIKAMISFEDRHPEIAGDATLKAAAFSGDGGGDGDGDEEGSIEGDLGGDGDEEGDGGGEGSAPTVGEDVIKAAMQLGAHAAMEKMEPVLKALGGRLEAIEGMPVERAGIGGSPDGEPLGLTTPLNAGGGADGGLPPWLPPQPGAGMRGDTVALKSGHNVAFSDIMREASRENGSVPPEAVAHLVMRKGGMKGGEELIPGLEIPVADDSAPWG